MIGGFGFTPPGVHAAAARCEQGTVLQLSARARIRVRPGAGQVDEERRTSRCAVHHQAQAGVQRKIYIFGGCTRAISR